ncbi:MAG: hypothetical protein MK078_10405 [Crocinitomicaceae bacterium]|nr:hypothetical protein [Crocinitomicaceae bacterium]
MIYFNKHLAFLYYEMAIADENLNLEEKEEIFKIINAVKIFDHSEEEKEEMYGVLRVAIADKLNSEQAFKSFEKYYYENNTFFDDSLKAQILEALDGIALASHGRNKSESVFYSRLFLLFEK